jgi:hypothetical protein
VSEVGPGLCWPADDGGARPCGWLSPACSALSHCTLPRPSAPWHRPSTRPHSRVCMTVCVCACACAWLRSNPSRQALEYGEGSSGDDAASTSPLAPADRGVGLPALARPHSDEATSTAMTPAQHTTAAHHSTPAQHSGEATSGDGGGGGGGGGGPRHGRSPLSSPLPAVSGGGAAAQARGGPRRPAVGGAGRADCALRCSCL